MHSETIPKSFHVGIDLHIVKIVVECLILLQDPLIVGVGLEICGEHQEEVAFRCLAQVHERRIDLVILCGIKAQSEEIAGVVNAIYGPGVSACCVIEAQDAGITMRGPLSKAYVVLSSLRVMV